MKVPSFALLGCCCCTAALLGSLDEHIQATTGVNLFFDIFSKVSDPIVKIEHAEMIEPNYEIGERGYTYFIV